MNCPVSSERRGAARRACDPLFIIIDTLAAAIGMAELSTYRALVSCQLAPLVAAQAAGLARVDGELEAALTVQADLLHLRQASGEGREARLLTDLSAGFCMAARVPPEPGGPGVVMHVGVGVYPELSLSEAQLCMSARVEALRRARARAESALKVVRADLTTADAAIAALGEARRMEGQP